MKSFLTPAVNAGGLSNFQEFSNKFQQFFVDALKVRHVWSALALNPTQFGHEDGVTCVSSQTAMFPKTDASSSHHESQSRLYFQIVTSSMPNRNFLVVTSAAFTIAIIGLMRRLSVDVERFLIWDHRNVRHQFHGHLIVRNSSHP